MLGLVVYETIDVAYNLVKVTYNSVRGLYYWYYAIDYPEEVEIKKRDKMIEELKERIEYLEHLHMEHTHTSE